MSGDPNYLAWLRKQPCACSPCASPSEAHHSTSAPTHAPGERPSGKTLGGKRGRGQKSHDAWAFPLCARHHSQLHRLTGYFASFDGDELARWQNEQSTAYRAEYDADQTVSAAPVAPGRPIPSSVDDFDADNAADGFYAEYPSIGIQGRHDLARLLTRALKAAREGKAA